MSTNLTETLQSQLITIVQGAIDSGKMAVDFAYAQAPLLVNEIITYHVAMYGICTVVGILCIGFSGWNLRNSIKQYSKDENIEIWVPVGIFGTLIPFLMGLVLFGNNFALFLKAWLAPHLFLIEYISSLTK